MSLKSSSEGEHQGKSRLLGTLPKPWATRRRSLPLLEGCKPHERRARCVPSAPCVYCYRRLRVVVVEP